MKDEQTVSLILTNGSWPHFIFLSKSRIIVLDVRALDLLQTSVFVKTWNSEL